MCDLRLDVVTTQWATRPWLGGGEKNLCLSRGREKKNDWCKEQKNRKDRITYVDKSTHKTGGGTVPEVEVRNVVIPIVIPYYSK